MADWTHVPAYPHTIRRDPPPTLISRFEDGVEQRRKKHTTFLRRFSEHYVTDATTMDAMLDFFAARGVDVTFTKIAYDPSDAAPGTTEVTVRFVEAFTFDRGAVNTYETDIEFLQVIP
jgi:hypothetical protein